jgi:primosomal protein N' (replication factor Y)
MPAIRFATVALSLPFKYHTGGTEGLTYSIPEELEERAQIGTRVLVPLGKLEKTGVLVATTHQPPDLKQKLRSIIDVLDPAPVFDEQFLEWTKWIAQYYMASWGDVLDAALPEGLKPETKSRVFLVDQGMDMIPPEVQTRGKRQVEVFKALSRYKNGVAIATLQKELKSKALHAVLNSLEARGIVRIERPLLRQAKARTVTVAQLPKNLPLGGSGFSAALADLERTSPRQANILLTIVQQMQMSPDEPLPVKLLLAKAGASAATFKALLEKGLVETVQRPISSVHPTDLHFPANTVLGKHDISRLTLTDEQQTAVHKISEKIHLGEHKTFLLHGVTGSGKTETYITLAKEVMESGGGVLVLVPEISLTPQLIDRFKSRLSITQDSEIAVLHSRMSVMERFAAWQSLVDGSCRIAIGARSAVFAPVKNLRLIVVDEEHEGAYKQYDSVPRYHARDAAVVRAAMLKAVAVLGSATPSLESYYNAVEGKYELITMKQRAKNASLPSIRILDLRTAAKRKGFSRTRTALTEDLRKAIQLRIERKEGVVLLQNRRGFSTHIECLNCGTAEMCPNCAVTLTFHQGAKQMRCHYCGYTIPMRTTCVTCGSEELSLGGLGTERVEEDLKIAFPDARIERMDLDTTSRKGSFGKILKRFGNGETDILLGTQMVAKGLDFPHVSLVGVISADTSLCLPDFRAAERTFQLLSQVSGRAGRSEELPGEVLIQTLQPLNPTILFAAQHNYEPFYQKEIEDRAKLDYPPFSRLILIEFRGLHENIVQQCATRFASLFPERASFYERLGPAPPSIPKLRGEYRWHLLIKDMKHQKSGSGGSDPNGDKIRRLLMGALDQYQSRFASPHVKVTVDVDVQGVL